jgi:hypothetical protein
MKCNISYNKLANQTFHHEIFSRATAKLLQHPQMTQILQMQELLYLLHRCHLWMNSHTADCAVALRFSEREAFYE